MNSDQFKHAVAWNFRAKEKIGNVRRGINIYVYQYKSDRSASEKFKDAENVKKTQDDSVFSKGWSQALLNGKYILIISTDCAYAEDEWNGILKIFNKSVVKVLDKHVGDRKIDCACGGGCS
ncbi:hypothetical protein [Deminuibacter soli]|uniref:Uncharacterized protein n=1 Tax=Deminuibacter soli TaxID=2291815 RepID=A0A3E1NIC3_9BACT|nr:hypothetical protein [Deminuibacter soli]RFM27672.1 hypothetical protein DXN05_13255 [Deminuibacter soli]